jgi:hypothetical protein
MAKQDKPPASKTAEPSGSSPGSGQARSSNGQLQSEKFSLPQRPSAIDQWADTFHIQIGALGVRLWFGTTRGDSSAETDIRAAIFLPGEAGRLFLAHARALAEKQKIEFRTTGSPATLAH